MEKKTFAVSPCGNRTEVTAFTHAVPNAVLVVLEKDYDEKGNLIKTKASTGFTPNAPVMK